MSRQILSDFRNRLQAVFGHRLQGIVLYGSQARGNASETSDIDLLVLLQGPIQLGIDLDRIVRALYPLQLEIDQPLHAFPVSVQEFEAGQFALYRNARREGMRL